jgi:hypothetical protein
LIAHPAERISTVPRMKEPERQQVGHAAGGEPEAPQRGPGEQQDAIGRVEADQLLVGVEAPGERHALK